jgi:hypothetical protein
MRRSIQRIGIIGFLLFLAKGIAWLSIPVLASLRGCAE